MKCDGYIKMPFGELFHTVFTDSGQVNPCGRDACQAMIERLEASGTGIFGNAEHGFLKLPDAFEAAKKLL